MEKTNLGISRRMLAAILFGAALVGGIIPTIIVVGYVLLKENDPWLKRMAVKTVVLLLIFNGLIVGIGILPDCLSWISSLLSIFNVEFNLVKVRSAFGLITSAISILEEIFFLLLAINALNEKTVRVPIVDDFINKYI